jgi:ABC-type branched-subunit amino acid transport system ATPase component
VIYLKAVEITKRFGERQILSNVSFAVSSGECVVISGPNGSGKTTLLDILSGLLRPDSGTIQLMGQAATGLRPWEVAKLGLSRSFQRPRLARHLSALENVEFGRSQSRERSTGTISSEWSGSRALMTELGLLGRAGVPSAQLSFGQQKLVDVARALHSAAPLLVLDEPLAGLASERIADVIRLLVESLRGGRAILIVEHNLAAVQAIATSIVSLENAPHAPRGLE